MWGSTWTRSRGSRATAKRFRGGDDDTRPHLGVNDQRHGLTPAPRYQRPCTEVHGDGGSERHWRRDQPAAPAARWSRCHVRGRRHRLVAGPPAGFHGTPAAGVTADGRGCRRDVVADQDPGPSGRRRLRHRLHRGPADRRVHRPGLGSHHHRSRHARRTDDHGRVGSAQIVVQRRKRDPLRDRRRWCGRAHRPAADPAVRRRPPPAQRPARARRRRSSP